jgi:hypothetical protein
LVFKTDLEIEITPASASEELEYRYAAPYSRFQ